MRRLGLIFALVLVVSACGGESSSSTQGTSTNGTSTVGAGTDFVLSKRTPLIINGGPDIVPFRGSDDLYHLVWEVPMLNATDLELTITKLEVTSGNDTILSLEGEELPPVLQVLGQHDPTDTVGPGQGIFAFLTASFDSLDEVPASLTHSVTITAVPIPEPVTSTGGEMTVDADALVPVLGPPLEAGSGYVAGSGCCRSFIHIRAGMGVDNGYYFVQRYAIDWEQVNDQYQFAVGDPSVPENYTIYGKKILAVADGTVVRAQDGLDDQVPGKLPGAGIPLDEADGNTVVIDIGDGLYVNYAHMRKGSLQVKVGDKVTKGQHIGNVGQTGNASAPHLHMHVMDAPSTFTANSRPYVFEQFTSMEKAASPEAWSAVENTDQPLPVVPVDPQGEHTDEVPLNVWIVTFP